MREEILRRLNVLSQQMPPENRQELLEIAEAMLEYVQNAGDQAFFTGDFERAIIEDPARNDRRDSAVANLEAQIRHHESAGLPTDDLHNEISAIMSARRK